MISSTPQAGWLDGIKNSFHWEGIKEKFYELQPLLIELGLTLGIGFATGFILKKFGKIFAFLIGILVILGVLQQLGAISISINWIKIQEWFGIQAIPVVDDSIFVAFGAWLKAHILQTLFFVIGFLLGLNVA